VNEPVNLGPFRMGRGCPLVVIAGPCVLQSEEKVLELGRILRDIAQQRSLPLVFKASFDKANRTSADSYRGPGLKDGLAILETVKRELGLCVLTDVHQPHQAQEAAQVVDVLQVPAFLCRQTDMLTAAGETGLPVNIKKGQFMAPADMAYAAEKVARAGGKPILTERGSMFGYRDLVVDMRSLVWMRGLGYPVMFDGTHSVQQPGSAGGATGGLREMAAPLVRSAVAAGVDGVYLEVYEDPDNAPCDGPNSLDPVMFARAVDQALAIRSTVEQFPGLERDE